MCSFCGKLFGTVEESVGSDDDAIKRGAGVPHFGQNWSSAVSAVPHFVQREEIISTPRLVSVTQSTISFLHLVVPDLYFL